MTQKSDDSLKLNLAVAGLPLDAELEDGLVQHDWLLLFVSSLFTDRSRSSTDKKPFVNKSS